MFSIKETNIFVSSDKKNEQSLIQVLRLSCILALSTCDGIAQETTYLKVLNRAVNISIT